MPSCIPDLSQRSPACEGMTDEGMAPVVDGQRSEAFAPQRLACREEPAAEGVTLEGLPAPMGLDRADEWVGIPPALGHPFRLLHLFVTPLQM